MLRLPVRPDNVQDPADPEARAVLAAHAGVAEWVAEWVAAGTDRL